MKNKYRIETLRYSHCREGKTNGSRKVGPNRKLPQAMPGPGCQLELVQGTYPHCRSMFFLPQNFGKINLD